MKKNKKWIISLSIILIITVLISTSVGSAHISVGDSFRLLLSKLPFGTNFIDTSQIKSVYETIIFNIRLPRILLSGLTGAGLAVVGASFQALFQNPLADPHILGVSSGAALGATIAMISGINIQFIGLGVVGIFAFVGSLVTVVLVYHIARVGSKVPVTNILLAGTAISTMLSSIISLLMTINREQIERVYMWTLGSFSSATWNKVLFLLFFDMLCICILILYAGELNIMLTGEDSAKSLGLDTAKVKKRVIVVASLLVAACVSVSGMIGFVGLVIPHCVRLLGKVDNRILIPIASFMGAIFMIICDTIARTIMEPSEIPVGVITALFGVPYFIFLLYRSKKGSRY